MPDTNPVWVDDHTFNKLTGHQVLFETKFAAYQQVMTEQQARLSKNFAELNMNMTSVTEILKKWVQGNPQGFATKQVEYPKSPDARSKPKSKGTDEINFKHVVIPKFKYEECECNKDVVHTFLFKWSNIRELRGTPDVAMAKETGLSLNGGRRL